MTELGLKLRLTGSQPTALSTGLEFVLEVPYGKLMVMYTCCESLSEEPGSSAGLGLGKGEGCVSLGREVATCSDFLKFRFALPTPCLHFPD